MISFLNLFPLLAISWLLFNAIIILLIHFLKIKFTYYWLLATLAILVAWLLVLFSRNGLPYIQNPTAILPALENAGLPNLIIDGVSWPYALVLITLSVVVYLTLVVHAVQLDWFTLAAGLALTAFGLLAVQSRDATTIRTAWAAIDIIEFFILFLQNRDRDRSVSLIKAYALRMVGVMLFLWGTVDTTLLIIAAGIRMVVIPAAFISEKELNLPRSVIYLLTFISPVSALIVFSRVALTIDTPRMTLLSVIILGIALFSGIAWFRSRDAFEGRRYWVFALGSFVVLSAIRGLLIASVAWGVAMVLSGGILFFDEKTFRRPIFLLVGMIAITSIPYMPTWDGASLYTSSMGVSIVFFILTQALLVSGYFKHIGAYGERLASPERITLLINPLRLAMMVGVYWLIAYLFWRDGVLLQGSLPWILSKKIIDYYIGLIIGIVSILIVLIWRSRNRFPKWIVERKIQSIPLDWFYNGGNAIFQLVGNVMGGLSSLIEGESGVLLTLLLLALLITFFIQGR